MTIDSFTIILKNYTIKTESLSPKIIDELKSNLDKFVCKDEV